MVTLYIVIAFLGGLALAFGILILSIRPRCRACDANISEAGQWRGYANQVDGETKRLILQLEMKEKLIDRLLLGIGIQRTEKTPTEIAEERAEREAEDTAAKELKARGGATYGD